MPYCAVLSGSVSAYYNKSLKKRLGAIHIRNGGSINCAVNIRKTFKRYWRQAINVLR